MKDLLKYFDFAGAYSYAVKYMKKKRKLRRDLVGT